MKRSIAFIVASLAFAGWVRAQAVNPTLPTINTSNNFNVVTGYGASTTNANNASAFQSAINAAAAASGGGTVEIPGPGIYLTGPLTMKSKVNLQIDAGAILRMLPYGTWSGTTSLLTYSSVSDLEISGTGAIDGQGGPWWASDPNSGLYMIYFDSCQRVLIENLTVSNAPAQQIVFKGSSTANVTIQGITISAPDSGASTPSHNTDGIDLVGSNSLVQNCVISTGDDNIAMGSSAAPTYNTLITNCTFGYGHGVSIGSYTTDNVTNLTVINCTFNNTQNGIRMKSDSGRGGTAQYLNYYNLTMTNILYAPIVIYSYYDSYGNPTDSGITPADAAGMAISNTSGEPIWRNIIISNLTATAGQPGMIWARLELPATNILLSKLNITAAGSFDLYNVNNVQIVDSQITNTSGNPTFALCNAQAIFSNSVSGASTITLIGDDNTNSLAFYNAPASCSDAALFDANPITLAGSLLSDTTSLTLPSSTPVNFTLGTNAATVNVTGNLTLNSTLNIASGGGFAAGNYTLFTYTGTESGQAVLGSTPAGFPGFNYSLSTNTSAKEVLFGVSKTVPTLVTAPTASEITYGQALSASTLSGGSASVPGSFAFTTPTTTPDAGTTNQSVTFTPTNTAQYTTFTFNVSVTVLQATPTLVTAPTASAITYGQALSASTLSGGSASVPGSFAFTTPTATPGVGTTNQSVTFSPTNNIDYSTISFNVSVTVLQATPTLVTAPTASAITYGQALSASTLSGGSASVPGSFAFTIPTATPDAGTTNQSVTFTPTNNIDYSTISFNVSVTVLKATPTLVTAPTASAITYGQALSASTLSGGSASVPGSFAFTTPTTTPGAGTTNQSVTFTPTNNIDYSTISFNVSVTVLQATPTLVTAPTASAITVGQALSASTLSGGSASVPGSFAFTTPTATPGVGTANQSVTFTPTNNIDYSTINFNVSVTVVSEPQPVITSVSISGANLTINGDNGVAGTYTVLTSTNFTLPFSNWAFAGTFTLSASGSFSQTVNGAVTASDLVQFYILQAP
jgi:uncharacterized protein YccT (UPF0319 family)